MMIYIGMDDTDNSESRGTGHLARAVAARLDGCVKVLGVVRHQLLFDPRVPYTKHNSSATLVLAPKAPADKSSIDLRAIFQEVKEIMLADFQPGSDPGLCVASHVPEEITRFGLKAKEDLVTQAEARELAAKHGLLLEGLGGTEGGVIGALAGVGLAAGGNDGRYVLVGTLRELSGLQPVSALIHSGVDHLQTLDGQPVTEGLVKTDKFRPARRGHTPVGVVQWEDGHWIPLKLD